MYKTAKISKLIEITAFAVISGSLKCKFEVIVDIIDTNAKSEGLGCEPLWE